MGSSAHSEGDLAEISLVGSKWLSLAFNTFGPRFVFKVGVGLHEDVRHGLHNKYRIMTHCSFARQHHRRCAIEHRVGNVGHLGSGRLGHLGH